MNKIRLSKPQKEVVRLMREGWELGSSRGIDGRVWLQRDGCGHGGKSVNVHSNTFSTLYKKKIIKSEPKKENQVWYLIIYTLTKLGEEIGT